MRPRDRRHEKAPRRQRRKSTPLRTAGAQGLGENRCELSAPWPRSLPREDQSRQCSAIGSEKRLSYALPRLGEGISRPFPVILPQQRQIEQPFAGIIHDIEPQAGSPGADHTRRADEPAEPGLARLIGEFHRERGNLPRGIRPITLGTGERREMIFIGEARQGIISGAAPASPRGYALRRAG